MWTIEALSNKNAPSLHKFPRFHESNTKSQMSHVCGTQSKEVNIKIMTQFAQTSFAQR